MSPLRILIVTHAPLSAEYGAGQTAISLGDALRRLGHNVTVWSPQPLPPTTRWWQILYRMRSSLDAFINATERFDVIDAPPSLITARAAKSGVLVARSVQPELLYLLYALRHQTIRGIRGVAHTFAKYLHTSLHILLPLLGWIRADYILCLGSLESAWMRKWFPWWKAKLHMYVNALPENDQFELRRVRERRSEKIIETNRFLWIGRWISHKGTQALIDFVRQWSVIHPKDMFTIAGCGTQAQKDCPVDLLQSQRLRICPSFTREELYTLLAEHDVGLFTSEIEGWGLCLNEMLESGMRVFATPTGGTPDLQPYFGGSLQRFPPLSDTISDSLVGGTSIEEYYEVFTWNKIAHRYEELLSSAPELKERAGRRIDGECAAER